MTDCAKYALQIYLEEGVVTLSIVLSHTKSVLIKVWGGSWHTLRGTVFCHG